MAEDDDAPRITMRQYLERVIDERDRQYDMRFRAAEIAVSAALSSQEKAVASAFLASEKAIIKAEEAQKDYNARSNEFRAQLDDQAKTLMARTEAMGLFHAGDEKLETMRLFFDSKLESQRLAFEKSLEGIVKDIASLRESRSGVAGASSGVRESQSTLYLIIGIIIAIIGLASRFVK